MANGKLRAQVPVFNEQGDAVYVDAVITQLEQNEWYAPFGADSDQIIIYKPITDTEAVKETWGTLQDFFEEWQNFKNAWQDFMENGKFLQYEHTDKNSESYDPNFKVKMLFEINDDIEIINNNNSSSTEESTPSEQGETVTPTSGE